MIKTKTLNDKKIIFRLFEKSDLNNPRKFKNFINSFIKENSPIRLNKKVSLNQEIYWLDKQYRKIKTKNVVWLLAEHNSRLVGMTKATLNSGRQNHVAKINLFVKKGYRNIKIGTSLFKLIINLAQKKLKPKPKILRLGTYPVNKQAMKIYKKFGFKEVARIPKQVEYRGRLIDDIIMLRFFKK